MHNFAIIGLGQFGQCMLEALRRRRRDVIVVDLDEAKVQGARDIANKAVKADALTTGLLQEVLPEKLDCAIVDLGDEMERSILVANYLQKLGVPQIVVEAVNAAHAEILRIVGATRVIFPEQEAAEHLAGVLTGGDVLDFFAVGEGFALIETAVPKSFAGKTLQELDLPRKAHVLVVALRPSGTDDEKIPWSLPEPDHALQPTDVMLLAGSTKSLDRVRSA